MNYTNSSNYIIVNNNDMNDNYVRLYIKLYKL